MPEFNFEIELNAIASIIQNNAGYRTVNGIDKEKLVAYLDACTRYIHFWQAEQGTPGGRSGQSGHNVVFSIESVQKMAAMAQADYDKYIGNTTRFPILTGIPTMPNRAGWAPRY